MSDMYTSIKENRYKLRRLIRLTGHYIGMTDAKKYQTYFLKVHNYLGIESIYYDLFLMANCQMNAHIDIPENVQSYHIAKQIYEKLNDPNHRVRQGLISCWGIEEVSVMLMEEKKLEYVHTRLLLDNVFEELALTI